MNQRVTLNGLLVGPAGPHFNAVAPKYFSTLRTPVLTGREFTTADGSSAPHVAVVNESFVKRYLSGISPIGQRVSIRANDMQIVGVVKDAAYESLRDAPPPTVYAPLAQSPTPGRGTVTLAIDAGSATPSVAPALQRLLQSKLPVTPILVRTFSAQIDRALIRERVMAALAGGLGAVALVLATIGLYGLLAYTVTRRMNEIEVRMALGAPRGQVLWLVVGDAGRLIAFGLVCGLPAAWASSRLVSSMLFGLAPTDSVTLVGAAGALLVSGLCASLGPALRAANVDPMVALRHD